MKHRTRTYYTATQKALMWERWKDGWTLQQIGKLFDRPHTSIQGILSKTGGIRPPERRRCATALTLAERERRDLPCADGGAVDAFDRRSTRQGAWIRT